jgi:pentatricopeptide repeat protein
MGAVNCPRNIIAYTSLVSGLCNQHRLDDAMVYLLKMLNEGIYPNEATWNVLVRGLSTLVGGIGPMHLIDHIVEDL